MVIIQKIIMDDRNKRSQASWKQVEGSTTIRINLNLKGKDETYKNAG